MITRHFATRSEETLCGIEIDSTTIYETKLPIFYEDKYRKQRCVQCESILDDYVYNARDRSGQEEKELPSDNPSPDEVIAQEEALETKSNAASETNMPKKRKPKKSNPST